MGLLARAALDELEQGIGALPPPAHEWLRRPETGLFMLRGRIGGTGDRFNLGEVTVTRCALRLATGETGVAYVRGRSHRHAELAALADALLQSPLHREAAQQTLIAPLERSAESARMRMQQQAQSTRVEFFTVAREASA
ncbi:MAG: phosphonate C-P lyase system protein PhnG [bacterium]|jgi:alpha-D-ribose 1-methylphosphonate 5-triphosphate synthase subunit PhnG